MFRALSGLFPFVVASVIPCGATYGSEQTYPSAAQRKVSPGHTTYYIDPAHGDDEQAGTSQGQAWRSFRRINQLRLAPGDRVHVISPGSFKQTLAITGAGTEESPIEIHFAAGRYDFYPDETIRRKYQISNTNGDPDNAKSIGILLEKAKHVRVTGPDAYLFYRGKMIESCIDGCEDISIRDLHFDYHRPTVSEYTVVAIGDGYADLKIHPDSHYAINDGQITWQGEGWSYNTGLAQELDLQTNEVWRRRDPLSGMTFKQLESGLVRAFGQINVKVGRVYQLRNTLRDCAGVFTRRSRNISWKNTSFHFLHGMGLVNQFSENLTFDTVRIVPNKDSGRTTAAWADGIQVSGCKGKVLVKDCVFSGAHDDAINIHGTHLRVVERLSERQIKVRFMHNQTFGFMAFNPGDEIEFVASDSLETYGPNKVEAATMLNPKELVLTLKEPVPARFKQNDAVENVTWTPEVEIRGCTVMRIPTRGFLVTTRRKVLIEDNRFLNTHMSAILLEDDARGWYESGCVRDMTIRGNQFIRCAEPAININPQNNVANDSVHRNIRIEGNDFVLRNSLMVRAKSTSNLRIWGNAIYAASELNEEQGVQTSDCSNVEIGENRFLPLSRWTDDIGSTDCD